MFTENKYTKIYYSIITRAQLRTLNGYKENHHIIPESIGGSSMAENMVYLTAREHFICHWLLTKMCSGQDKHKMIYALNGMLSLENDRQQRYRITGRKYELLKKLHSSIHSERMYGEKNPMKDPDVKQKHQDAIDSRGPTKGMKGKKHSQTTINIMKRKRAKQIITEETKQKLREINLNRDYESGTKGKVAWHNTLTLKNKFFEPNETPPTGWVKGLYRVKKCVK